MGHDTSRKSHQVPDLLLRPRVTYQEGPQGYLLRLAEENCLAVNDLKQLGARFDVDWLMANGLLAGIPVGSITYRYVELVTRARNKRIWNDRFARFCPKCLAETEVWQVGWELLFHDACPLHGVWLVDRCSRCGDWIRPSRHRLLWCRCDADLRTETAQPAPENVALLSSALAHKLVSDGSGPLSVAFGDLDVEGLQKVIRYLGVHLDPRAGRRPLKIHSAGMLQVSWPVSTQAAEILFRWPSAFHLMLDRIQETDHERRKGFAGLFRQTYHYLYKNLPEPCFDPLRIAFQDWVSEFWKGPLAKRNHRLPASVIDNPAFVPLGVAASEFGISKRCLRHLVRTGQLEGEETVSQSGRRFLMIRRDDGERMSHCRKAVLNRNQVMAALGLGKKRTSRLLPLLFPTASRTNDASHMPWRIPQEEVEKLTTIGETIPSIDVLNKQQVSLAHLLRYWCWSIENIVGLVCEVRSGVLRPNAVLRAHRGVGRWVFNAQDIRRWYAARNQHVFEGLTIEMAAKALGTHAEVVSWLVSGGFLEVKRASNLYRSGNRIHRNDVDKFRSRYVFATEVAAQLVISSKRLRTMLASNGIDPLQMGEGKACRQLIYERTERLSAVVDQALKQRSEMK